MKNLKRLRKNPSLSTSYLEVSLQLSQKHYVPPLKELNSLFKHKTQTRKSNLEKSPDTPVSLTVSLEYSKKKELEHFIEEILPTLLDISQPKLLILPSKTLLEFTYAHLTQKLNNSNIY